MTVQIQISWLLQKPTDVGLHCFLRQGISCSARERFSMYTWPSFIGLDKLLFFFHLKVLIFFLFSVCVICWGLHINKFCKYIQLIHIISNTDNSNKSFYQTKIWIMLVYICFMFFTVQLLLSQTIVISNWQFWSLGVWDSEIYCNSFL